jgi:hypothetical protein
VYIRALLKKAVDHLNGKKADAENPSKLDITSGIEEQIGYIWKLEELAAYGMYIQNAEIYQLSFNVYDDIARKEFVDVGYHICLQNGAIYVTKNYRPYKAKKYIGRDDTVFSPIVVEELYMYPGGMNPRIRFSKYAMRERSSADLIKIKQYASVDFAETAKSVKDQIKTPLADKNPAALLLVCGSAYSHDKKGNLIMTIIDGKGTRQQLTGATVQLLGLMEPAFLAGQALLVVYENNMDTGLLTARPLSLVTDDRIIRLEY